MKVKLRPMTQNDYKNMGTPLHTTGLTDPYKLLEDFGYLSDSDFEDSFNVTKQSLSNRNVRYTLKLAVPTFNYVLGTSRMFLLRKILGYPEDLWLSILNLTSIYDCQLNDYVRPEDATPEGDYLYGAQIVEMLINNFDIEEETKRELMNTAVLSSCKQGTVASDVGEVSRVQGDKAIELTAGYYFNPISVDALVSHLKRGRTLETFYSSIHDNMFKGYKSRASLLLNMKDKVAISSMLNYYISIVPSELRPKVQNRKHPLTGRYASVLNANSELTSFLKHTQTTPKSLALKIKALDSAVSKLQYKNVGTGVRGVKPDDLALMERFKQKKGQVRLHNLGKSQDFSGRSVVVINPWLPQDRINVPKRMIPALYEMHALPYLKKNLDAYRATPVDERNKESPYNKIRLHNLRNPVAQREIIDIVIKEGILGKVPIILGRQPSLHKHSAQGFYVGIAEGDAIEVPPLPCPGFNMDFDGDTGYIMTPIGYTSIQEVIDLMITTRNVYLPKTGDVTLMPRQEILYGLYMCTKNDYDRSGKAIRDYTDIGPYTAHKQVYEEILRNHLKVWDMVNVNGKKMSAGDAAFSACFKRGDIHPRGFEGMSVTQITGKNIDMFVQHALRCDLSGNSVYSLGKGKASPDTFTGCLNHLVELGFKVARLYPVSMSLIQEEKQVPLYDNAISTFYNNLEEDNYYYTMGLETDENYSLSFNRCLDELKDTMQDNIINKLGNDNGYYILAESGARGNKANLLQVFAYKGQVKKNESEAFDALLQTSYAGQLTAFDALVDAYGGRQGMMDKSLKTGDTGYVSRQLWQCLQGNNITVNDCGTTDGLEINKAFLATMVDADTTEIGLEKVKDFLVHTLEGRYLAETPALSSEELAHIDSEVTRLKAEIYNSESPAQALALHKELEKFENAKATRRISGASGVGLDKPLTRAQAIAIANDVSIKRVVMRSPITCKNPCCVKCYGIDWDTHKAPTIGKAVDIIAAQSIGEPSTQLTMTAFQKGGVATKGEMTSSFDKVKAYIHVADLSEMSKKGSYVGYDPIAWANGPVIESQDNDITLKVLTIEGSKRSVKVPKEMRVKDVAVHGQGLCYRRGDYDLNEIMDYCGIAIAQRYLVFKLYNLFSNEVKLKFIHLEMLVSSATRHLIIDTDRNDLLIGQTYTTRELYRGNISGTKFKSRLINILDTTKATGAALDSIIMEDQVDALSRACILGLEDNLDKPINAMVVGKMV